MWSTRIARCAGCAFSKAVGLLSPVLFGASIVLGHFQNVALRPGTGAASCPLAGTQRLNSHFVPGQGTEERRQVQLLISREYFTGSRAEGTPARGGWHGALGKVSVEASSICGPHH